MRRLGQRKIARVGRLGQPRLSASAAFDPATLSLAGWWRASYGGSPWSGTASAGGSGSQALSEATNPPAVGGAVNGLTPADYDGVNDRLTNASDFGATFMSTTALTIIGLVNMDTLGADAAGFAEETLVGDSGGFVSMNIATSGIRLYCWDGAEKDSAYTAISTGAWTMIAGKLDSGFLYSRINAGSWSAGVACGAISIPGGQTLISGRNVAGTQFIDGKVLEIMIAPSVISDADYTNIRGYFNARYSLSL